MTHDPDWDWVDDLTQPRPVAIAIAVLVVLCVVAVTGAMAQGVERPKGGVIFDCADLGLAIERIAAYRDVGADVEKTVELYRKRNPHLGGPQYAAFAREVRRLWREQLPAQDAGFALYLRCQRQLGDMGRDG